MDSIAAVSSGIRDNRPRRGTVGDYLREKIRPGADLSFVSAYFTIYAYQALQEQLNQVERLRFLFGEPSFVQGIDPERSQRKFFRIEDDVLRLVNKLEQKRVARECARWIEAKVDVRSIVREGFLHGKMYHIANRGVEDAILGSSNFTVHGLGLAPTGNNIELNLEVDSNRDRRDLKAWFDELWNDTSLVRDVKDQVLQYLEQLYCDQSPEFLYYKTLFHVFEKFLGDANEVERSLHHTTLLESQVWHALFDFQKDGVKGAINKILAYNGCILADSVGLGKTFEALAVIKFFETRNERVLVLCPKKLRENWSVYQAHTGNLLNPFPEDRFGFTLLHHTDLSRDQGDSAGVNLATFNWGAYDLVVIDESHNFRNNAKGKRDENGEIVRLSRYERLMRDIIGSGVRTKVLLLSATPVNNTLTDIRNQISIIAGGDVVHDEKANSAFRTTAGIADVKETIRRAQTYFTAWAKLKPEKRTISGLLERLGSDFFKLLDALTIARSRRHIERYYRASLEELGGFPTRTAPVSIYPELDNKRLFMDYDRLNDEISRYTLSLFNPSRFVRPEYRAEYERQVGNFTQSQREDFLIGMMKVGFLKRLESSVHSFSLTLERTLAKIEDLEERIGRFQRYQADNPEIDLGSVVPDELDDEEMRDALEVGKKLTFRLAHLRLDDWSRALHEDRRQLHSIYVQAKDVDRQRDAKLAELKTIIRQKATSPTSRKDGRPNRKVLVFTAFADTAAYLYDSLVDWLRTDLKLHVALVTGGGQNKTTLGSTDFHQILVNFSPESKQRGRMASMPQAEEIDVLIATDCISEGQNLQDCDTVVNYDIHWNPVRIIQRFGRVDRLKSPNAAVHLVNFWPTDDLNKYIDLKHRVEARMALVDISTTADDNLLQSAPLEELIGEELRYRDRQLRRLQREILDMDELNEDGVTLTEFTLDDFRQDLLNYLEANRALLENAPLGLYAVVPPDPAQPVIAPGVIFCLRQIPSASSLASAKDQGSPETINPLQPHFLVYVRDDGNVRFTFAQPKQILEIQRLLCAGRGAPYDTLCQLFDQETNNGNAMDKYSVL
ncbi:MAG TPA: helicase-related protein, partial [Chloroflexota bacterium]|nr:helicase-related protein [Chloroflexota bacterium]